MLQLPNVALKKSTNPTARIERQSSKHIMTPTELHIDMNQFGAQLGADPEAAILFLKQAGILNTKGKLGKEYR
jgi:hypothetical protein